MLPGWAGLSGAAGLPGMCLPVGAMGHVGLFLGDPVHPLGGEHALYHMTLMPFWCKLTLFLFSINGDLWT